MSTTTTALIPESAALLNLWDDKCFIIAFRGMQVVQSVNTTLLTFKGHLENEGLVSGDLTKAFDQFMAAKGFHKGKTVELSFANRERYLITKR